MEHAAAGYQSNYSTIRFFKIVPITLRTSFIISDKTAAASVEDVRNIIANGKRHMPKYTGKLTSEEIDSLVQQIRAANGK